MIVPQFLRWIESAGPGRRAEAAHALARAYLFSVVDAEERRGMEAAMTILLDDPSPDVRFALADALGNSADAPRHLILALSTDAESAAVLVLNRSPVFLDAELVDAFAGGSGQIQAAIASRAVLSAPVAAAIAEVGDAEPCRLLAENTGAAMTRRAFSRLAERWGSDPEIRDTLLSRDDLPLEIREALVRRLGEALGSLVSMKAWMEPGKAREVTREACERATVAMASDADPQELVRLAAHLRTDGQLNARLLLRALCAGNLSLFEAALSVLADLPEGRVARMVRSRRRMPLKSVCRKAGLPMRAFDAFSAAIDAAVEAQQDGIWDDGSHGRHHLEHALAERVLAQYGEAGGEAADDLLALLRRLAAEAARAAAREYAEERTAAA